MPGSVIARLFAIGVVIGLSGFAAFRGWGIVEFATAHQVADAAESAPAIATAALDASLDDLASATGPDAVRRRTELLTRLLSLRPLSSIGWLSLAGMRLVTGESYGRVLGALRMSAITGPNEAGIMWQRAMFCLLQWEALPAEFQQQAILDLSGSILGGRLDDGGAQQVKGLLAGRDPAAQAQIATMLGAQGVEAQALEKIGLNPTQGAQ